MCARLILIVAAAANLVRLEAKHAQRAASAAAASAAAYDRFIQSNRMHFASSHSHLCNPIIQSASPHKKVDTGTTRLNVRCVDNAVHTPVVDSVKTEELSPKSAKLRDRVSSLVLAAKVYTNACLLGPKLTALHQNKRLVFCL